MGKPGKRVDGGAGVRVRIEADAALGADAAPLVGEERAAEQVGRDRHGVVAPLVALRADARQGGLIGEERQLERLGHRVVRGVWAGFTDKCITGPDSPRGDWPPRPIYGTLETGWRCCAVKSPIDDRNPMHAQQIGRALHGPRLCEIQPTCRQAVGAIPFCSAPNRSGRQP